MDKLPIIIGGFYRSGTSLLRRMMDCHSNIHCGPEIKFFRDFYGDYRYDELRHIRFFSTLRTLELTEQELLTIFGTAFVKSHELAARKRNKKRWADKNPENVMYLKQWYKLLPEGFYFIHVKRHPLDALSSLKEVGFAKTIPSDYKEKVILFQKFLTAANDYSELYPQMCTTVHYEDLVIKPYETLSDLLSKIDEEFEPLMLKEFNSTNRQCGIEDPKVKKTKIIHTDSIGRWKNDLVEEEVVYALSMLGTDYR